MSELNRACGRDRAKFWRAIASILSIYSTHHRAFRAKHMPRVGEQADASG